MNKKLFTFNLKDLLIVNEMKVDLTYGKQSII